MQRHREFADQYVFAYGLYTRRAMRSGHAIKQELERQFTNRPSLAQIYRWVKQFEELDQKVLRLDEPFQWHELDAFGLPWESSKFLLEVSADLTERRYPPIVVTDDHGRKKPLPPTWREMRWVWRVHQAFGGPDEMVYGDHISPELRLRNYLSDVEEVAAAFASREVVHHLLGVPLELADLEAFSAYRPWESDSVRLSYLRAVEDGLIPSVRPINLRDVVRTASEAGVKLQRSVTAKTWPDPDRPGLLPSGVA